MSQDFAEGKLTFKFPAGWHICRPEITSFYIWHFQKFCGGSKEMDFLAFDPVSKTLWLIEVKDYRIFPRTKQGELADEVAHKTRDVLALLLSGAIRDEGLSSPKKVQVKEFWSSAYRATNLRVILHCELPRQTSKLFPGVKDSANLQSKLSQKLHCIDPHAQVTSKGSTRHIPWTVH